MKHLSQYNKSYKKSEKNKSGKNKKAVSMIVTYVLFVGLSLSLAGLVYGILKYKAKLPEEIKCPEGTSIYIVNISCGSNYINLTIKNNGFFTINGTNYVVYNMSDNELGICNQGNSSFILEPDNIHLLQVTVNCDMAKITKIKLLPYRIQKKDVRSYTIYCADAAIEKEPLC